MSQPDPRWTDQTEVLVAVSIHNADCEWDWDDCRQERRHQRAAREVLTALAGLGVLLPLGGEVREEWGVADDPTHPHEVWPKKSEAAARLLASAKESIGLRRRSWYPGPWIEVSS